MIQTEIIEIGGKQFKRTYSDNNKVIRKVGTSEEYSEAVDLTTATYEYEEAEKGNEFDGEENIVDAKFENIESENDTLV